MGAIQSVEKSTLRDQLKKYLVEEIFKYLQNLKKKNPFFNPNSLLEPHHQSFSERKRELPFGQKVIRVWEQRSISIKDAVDIVREENLVDESSKIENIKIKFL